MFGNDECFVKPWLASLTRITVRERETVSSASLSSSGLSTNEWQDVVELVWRKVLMLVEDQHYMTYWLFNKLFYFYPLVVSICFSEPDTYTFSEWPNLLISLWTVSVARVDNASSSSESRSEMILFSYSWSGRRLYKSGSIGTVPLGTRHYGNSSTLDTRGRAHGVGDLCTEWTLLGNIQNRCAVGVFCKRLKRARKIQQS